MKISLCLLTWNEIDGCKNDIPNLPLSEFDEVFAVDAGSTDGTVEYLQECGINVFRQTSPSYNGAYIDAFRQCSTEALVFFHPKGSVDPGYLKEFRKYLADGYDLVVASRNMLGARNEEDEQFIKPRKWFVRALGVLGKLLWQRDSGAIFDVLHGMRAMRKESFFAISPLDHGVTIDFEMVVRAYRLKLPRIEFPISEQPRLTGETHFKAFPTGVKMLKYIVFELTRGKPV